MWCICGGNKNEHTTPSGAPRRGGRGRARRLPPFLQALDGHPGVPEISLEHLAARVGGHVDGAWGAEVEGPLVGLKDPFDREALPLDGHRLTRLDLGEGGLRDLDRVKVEAEVYGYGDQSLLSHEQHQVALAAGAEISPEKFLVAVNFRIVKGPEKHGVAAFGVV